MKTGTPPILCTSLTNMEYFHETPLVGTFVQGIVCCFGSWTYLPMVKFNAKGHTRYSNQAFAICMPLQNFSVQ